MQKKWITAWVWFIWLSVGISQSGENNWLKTLEKIEFKPSLTLQTWASYSFGQHLWSEKDNEYLPVSNRIETQIRRTRFGFSVRPYSRLSIKFVSSVDFIGRDVLSATVGGSNNGANPAFRLWVLTGQWKMTKENEGVYITFGYMAPQIGRESITGLLGSTGMEKVWTQNYLRRHITGTGPGRATGINLGGLAQVSDQKLRFSYNIGVFNPVFQAFSGNSTGIEYAPMLAGKLSLHLGDPENDKYSLGHKANYFSQRKGLTVGIQTTYQGRTDLFAQNSMIGLDLLFNWKHLNIDGEWLWLRRDGFTPNQEAEARAQVRYIKMSYNIFLPGKYMIEPVIMLSTYSGEKDLDKQMLATQVQMPSGMDHVLDAGFNFYLNPKLKLSLHYTKNNGEIGQMPLGSPVNNYFQQNGAGAIQRGNWIGFGIVIGV
jgi:hypothetical protein